MSTFLSIIEKLLLLAAVAGAVMLAMNINQYVLGIAVLGLGIVYFSNAFRKPVRMEGRQDKADFLDMMAWNIAPKIMWIGSAITCLGIAFYLFETGVGYLNMLKNGCFAISLSIFIMMIGSTRGIKHLEVNARAFYRSVPLLAIGMYLLFGRFPF